MTDPSSPWAAHNDVRPPTPGPHGYPAPGPAGHPGPHGPQQPGYPAQHGPPPPGYAQPHPGWNQQAPPSWSTAPPAPLVAQPAMPAPGAPAPGTPLPARRSLAIGEAFGALTNSPNWLGSAFTGGLLAMIPLVGLLIIYGWSGEIIRRTSMGYAQPVPQLRFSDAGYWLKRGVAPFLAYLGWSTAISIAANIVMIPAIFAVLAIMAIAGEVVGAIAMGALMLLLIGGSLALAPFYASAMTTAELSDDVGAAFRFQQVIAYGRGTWKSQLVGQLATSFIGMPIMLLGMLFFIVGIFPAIALVMVANAHIRGQVYSQWLARGGAPLPARPPEASPTEAAAMHATMMPRTP